MKMKYILILCLFITSKSIAQNYSLNNKEFECVYAVVYNNPIDVGTSYSQVVGKLYITNSNSLFYCIPTNDKKQIKNNESESDPNLFEIKIDTIFKVIKHSNINKLNFKDNLFSKKGKYFADTLHPMKWELIDSSRKIDNLQCFKAKTYYKGRDYIAWYCPEIAISNGPWKLGGLPGLIIETYDSKEQIHFLLKSIKSDKMIEYAKKIIKQSEIFETQTYGEYIKSGKKFIENLRAQINGQTSDNCLTCQNESNITLHTLEIVFD